MILEGTGFVIDEITGKIELVDLKEDKKTQSFDLQSKIVHTVLSEANLYIFWNDNFNLVTTFDSQGNCQTTQIDCYLPMATSIICKQGKAYVTSYLRKSLHIIDLNTKKRLKTLAIDQPTTMHIFDYNLCVWQCSPTDGSYTLVDLETAEITANHNLQTAPGHTHFQGNVGYIYDDEKTVIIYDLHFHKQLAKFVAMRREDVVFLDSDLYFGKKKIATLQDYKIHTLFDIPYKGIEGSLFEDGEKAFYDFEQAVVNKDHGQAQIFFNTALAAGHPKAYAIAAFAFFMGRFGAKENVHWWGEFMVGADIPYFLTLFKKFD